MTTRPLAAALVGVALAGVVLAGCGPGVHPHVAPLLDAPTALVIDVEGGTGVGRVTGARLAGDSLWLRYAYPAPEGERTGVVAGALAGPVLVGTFDTSGPGTRFRGPLRLTFAAGGAASGVWNDGEGAVEIDRRAGLGS